MKRRPRGIAAPRGGREQVSVIARGVEKGEGKKDKDGGRKKDKDGGREKERRIKMGDRRREWRIKMGEGRK